MRGTIHLDPIKEREDGDVAYIKISSFSEQTQPELTGAIKNARRSIGAKLKGYIIDLRNNPGGLLNKAIDVSDDFLDDGTIVLTKGRDPAIWSQAVDHPGDLTQGLPIVVLINGGSASHPKSLRARCRITGAPPSSAPARSARGPCRPSCRCGATVRCG